GGVAVGVDADACSTGVATRLTVAAHAALAPIAAVPRLDERPLDGHVAVHDDKADRRSASSARRSRKARATAEPPLAASAPARKCAFAEITAPMPLTATALATATWQTSRAWCP